MNEALLLSQIESIRLKREPGQAVGVHSKSRWQGKNRVLVGQEHWRVFQCDSVLEMRQHLIENPLSPLLLVTALQTAAIGDDVRRGEMRRRNSGQGDDVGPTDGALPLFRANR